MNASVAKIRFLAMLLILSTLEFIFKSKQIICVSYSKSDCVEALKEAKNKLGDSPTMKDYQESEFSPSIDTILKHFGTWNEAKKEANLRTYQQSSKIEAKPGELNLPKDKEWKELSSYQRYYYKNREKEKQRTKQRTQMLKKWFKQYKRNFKCEKCGEAHPACLDFHHRGEKKAGVAELVSRKNTSKKRIKEEIEKCIVMCANCHRKEHSSIEI